MTRRTNQKSSLRRLASLKPAGLVIVGALLLLAGGCAAGSRSLDESRSLAGLRQPAEIIIDRWGLAHIYAQNEDDAYFMQGYNAARDRLWQIDLWRKRGLGRLSASFGPGFIKQDRAARLFLYRGDMDAEWERYAPGARERYIAFAAGVNAYVDEVLKGDNPLPVEFRLTQTLPEHWSAEEMVRIRTNTLVSNGRSEVLRAHTLCKGGPVAERLRRRLYPDKDYVAPDGLDPCSIPENVMEDYRLATGNPDLSGVADVSAAGAPDGSNHWVVAPSRTATGRPILANDPHRAFSTPSLRYVVHMEAPGLSLIGAGEPAAPGVSLGHNGEGAFGLTIFNADQEDVYFYDLKPGDPTHYRYGEGWERMRIVHEEIPVKGADPATAELRFTRHGPVLLSDEQNNRAYALRSVWFEPGASGYAAASWLASARDWRDFIDAADHWGTPPLNLIWADKSGEIGWAPAGLMPVRPNWDGLLPVSGDGRYEWRGFFKRNDLPQARNPEKGWFANANERNLPADFKDDPPIAYEWFDRSRIDRIDEVIGATTDFSIADAMRLQTDTHSVMARRLIALAEIMEPEDAATRSALKVLRDWDFDLTADDVAPTIYEVWLTQHLGSALISRVVPADTQKLLGQGYPDAILHVLESRDPMLGSDPEKTISATLNESFKAAIADLRQRFGDDMTTWRWGRLHKAGLEHPLASLAGPALASAMSIDPVPVGGSASTPAMTLYRGNNFTAVHGPSVRLVIDVGDWDRSTFMNMPGQSGDPESEHYRDLFLPWVEGRFAALSYSRDAVERVAERTIHFSPAP